MGEVGIESGSKKGNRSSCDPLSSNSIIQGVSGSPISVVLPSSYTSSSSNGKIATGSSCLEDISRDPSFESLLGVSMDELDSQTNFLYAVDGPLPFRNRTESTYVGPDELPPSKDEESLKFRNEAMVYVTDILNNETKTMQGLLDSPNMTLLRALFDVPKATDDYKAIAKWVMTLFRTCNKLMYLMQVAIRQEVQCTCVDALFRQDTMVCTLASSFLKSVGGDYLNEILGPVICKVAPSKKSFEIDLHKPGGQKTNEKRVRKLVGEILKALFESSPNCPLAVREFLFYMRNEIRDRYTSTEAESTVRSFYFLRFVCPIIVNPRENGTINKFPTEEAKRGLCIAARIVQTLANDGECDTSQPHLLKLNKLILDNKPNMRKYIEGLSNKSVATKETGSECVTSNPSRKLAVEELQKYMYHKIKMLPTNPTPEEKIKNEPVIKLRRALQACNKSNNLVRSTSSPSSSPSHFASRLLASESPSKRHSSIDLYHAD
eukprot:Phypoly_transcript_06364.p1 GENE.Phypoly_transcript_06364~~Phypoly_transcript_06364.p1  ORF type:complete len:491 (-),score=52.80 Phypoly_transcript_06364:170-1642(-)